jgi:DNA polymerase-1
MPFQPDLPPIRSLIKPDPGWVLVDADFDRADAQIVAWSANEPALKVIFQEGLDVHTENAALVSGWAKKVVSRQALKAGLHLTNYGGKARTLAATLGTTIAIAEAFQHYWFGKYPGIRRWHESTLTLLRLQHYIRNVWGFRRFYFERLDGHNAEALLPQALAWLGQSGVAIAINHAMLQVRAKFPRDSVRLKLQVHDSLLLEVREDLCPGIFPEIIQAMQVRIPFDDPLYIPVSLKYSPSSWGEVHKWSQAA